MEWININERLPEKDVPVLCLYDENYIDVMEYWYDNDQGKPVFMRPTDAPVDYVRYWMPLPEKPTPTILLESFHI